MKSTAMRVQKHRSNLRHKGLKLVQIWVPDVRSVGFVAECKRQSLIAKNDENEHEISNFIEKASDLQGWE